MQAEKEGDESNDASGTGRGVAAATTTKITPVGQGLSLSAVLVWGVVIFVAVRFLLQGQKLLNPEGIMKFPSSSSSM
jgi:hypothetical protein